MRVRLNKMIWDRLVHQFEGRRRVGWVMMRMRSRSRRPSHPSFFEIRLENWLASQVSQLETISWERGSSWREDPSWIATLPPIHHLISSILLNWWILTIIPPWPPKLFICTSVNSSGAFRHSFYRLERSAGRRVVLAYLESKFSLFLEAKQRNEAFLLLEAQVGCLI